MEEQTNRGKPQRYIEYRGEQRKLSELAKQHGIDPRTLATRIDRYGWTIEKAVNEPVKNGGIRKVIKGRKVPVESRSYGIRTQIVNRLMETFFNDPRQFEEWIQGEMKSDYGSFYKTYIMPFLPKDSNPLLDGGKEKATISVEFNIDGRPQSPPTIDITEQ